MDTPEVQKITVRDRLGPVCFQGYILADCRYGRMDKPRWTDMVLFKIESDEILRSTGVLTSSLMEEFSEELSDREPFFRLGQPQQDALNTMLSRTLGYVVDTQPAYRYALNIIARSYVYHRADGPCVRRRQKITTVSQIKGSNHRWRNLFPCVKCRPGELEDMGSNQQVAEESEKHQLYLCTSASDILARLYQRSGDISELSARLLIQAEKNDPEIKRTLKRTRTLYPGIIETMKRVQEV